MIAAILTGMAFVALLIYAAVTDLKRREVDDWICVAILIVSLYGSGGSFWGAVLTALPFFLPALFKGGSIGAGDIKLMFACGAVLGIWGGFLQTILALSLTAIFSLGILLTKGFATYRKTAIPLAPFLCAGGIAAFIITKMGG